ncbi:hypothetical protein BJF92_17060 [Rhizobium rhizosphaerae]|uniref:Uncharacterized protein n=1 Tax=Xaviernesmea rhizosphaerae TaxID=1672749 RepID=A0A1Q9AIM8_9HYPH|nr:hypothetical protein [Xaviernesmea rhizosphaerae]OLP55105.1 hypothetical protein BJF92_17060 [Xaviernesmea rhizosphaerae]OQP84367.1 hypothetical protein BTR14_19555 [Xaviernesmea rhizosphaerae]
MIKLLLTGIWACVVTLGAVYFSVQHASAPKVSEEEATRAALQEYVPGELITVPVIANGGVQGYFLAKLSYAADKTKTKTLQIPLKEGATSALYNILVGKKLINIADTSNFDLTHFKDVLRDGLNEVYGDKLIFEVYVEQLEYLNKADLARLAQPPDEAHEPKPVPVVDKNGATAHEVMPGKDAPSGH